MAESRETEDELHVASSCISNGKQAIASFGDLRLLGMRHVTRAGLSCCCVFLLPRRREWAVAESSMTTCSVTRRPARTFAGKLRPGRWVRNDRPTLCAPAPLSHSQRQDAPCRTSLLQHAPHGCSLPTIRGSGFGFLVWVG